MLSEKEIAITFAVGGFVVSKTALTEIRNKINVLLLFSLTENILKGFRLVVSSEIAYLLNTINDMSFTYSHVILHK